MDTRKWMGLIVDLLAVGLVPAWGHDGLAHSVGADGVVMTERGTGNGSFRYQTVPGWGRLPGMAPVGPTHGGVAVDAAGNVYVSTNAAHGIVVYDEAGEFQRFIGKDFSRTHALCIVKEAEGEFLYGAFLGDRKLDDDKIFKMTLEGDLVWTISSTEQYTLKGLTGVAVASDGTVFATSGYGKCEIFKMTQEGRLIGQFGSQGESERQFKTSHGIAVDYRYEMPRLLVADREKHRLVHLDLDGNWIGVHAEGLRRPCAISFEGDFCLVAELQARVTVVDRNGHLVAFLGDNPKASQWANYRVAPEDMEVPFFTAPHGLSTGPGGVLYVQDWNATGRITKLVRK